MACWVFPNFGTSFIIVSGCSICLPMVWHATCLLGCCTQHPLTACFIHSYWCRSDCNAAGLIAHLGACYMASGMYMDLCRPLAPGSYNVSAVLKGCSTVSADIKVPKDGIGVVHNFTLSCTTYSAGWNSMYSDEVLTDNTLLQF